MPHQYDREARRGIRMCLAYGTAEYRRGRDRRPRTPGRGEESFTPFLVADRVVYKIAAFAFRLSGTPDGDRERLIPLSRLLGGYSGNRLPKVLRTPNGGEARFTP